MSAFDELLINYPLFYSRGETFFDDVFLGRFYVLLIVYREPEKSDCVEISIINCLK